MLKMKMELILCFFLVSEILDLVEKQADPAFRPDISGYDCPEDLLELMNKCWADNFDERPSFENIRDLIRRTMK